MISINFNPTILGSQCNLNKATSAMVKALERMSTGYKINSAKDDAAGMYVATGLNSQLNGVGIASSNVSNGLALLNIAEGSLSNIIDITGRLRDLAVQGANGVFDDTSRLSFQSEADLLVQEISRTRESTLYNGMNIFDGSAPPPRNFSK